MYDNSIKLTLLQVSFLELKVDLIWICLKVMNIE